MIGCNVEPLPALLRRAPMAAAAPASILPLPPTAATRTRMCRSSRAGDWYNFYSGPKGRLRFGLQYSRFERDLWSGAGGTTNPGGGANGIDNMFWTSFRYYLP